MLCTDTRITDLQAAGVAANAPISAKVAAHLTEFVGLSADKAGVVPKQLLELAVRRLRHHFGPLFGVLLAFSAPHTRHVICYVCVLTGC